MARAYSHPPRHGHAVNGKASPTYYSWRAMITRCTNEKSADYENYGGRGIKVCDRWLHSFEAFLADMGERPAGTQLDREDTNGDYTPDNCRWATPLANANNRRNNVHIEFDGLRLTQAEWARKTGLSLQLIRQRLANGWTVADALTKAPKTRWSKNK